MAAEQPVIIPLGLGLDTNSDPKMIAESGSLKVCNADHSTPGAIKKRTGFDKLPKDIIGGGTISSGAALYEYKDQLLLADGKKLYSWAPQAQAWADVGPLTCASISTRDIVQSTQSAGSVGTDFAFANGCIAIVYFDEHAIPTYTRKLTVVSAETGAVLMAPTTLPGTTSLAGRLTASGDKIFYVYTESNALKMRVVDTSDPATLAAAVTLDATTTVQGLGDIQPFSDEGEIAVVYENNGGFVTLLTANASGVITGPTATSDSPAASSSDFMALVVTKSQFLFYVYRDSADPDIFVGCRNADLTQAFAGKQLDSGLPSVPTGANLRVTGIEGLTEDTAQFFTWGGSTSTTAVNAVVKIRTAIVTSGGTISDLATISHGLKIHSAPYKHNGKIYLIAGYTNQLGTNLQQCYFLIDADGAPCGRILPGTAAGLTNKCNRAGVFEIRPGVFATAVVAINSYSAILTSDTRQSQMLLEIDHNFRPDAALINNNLYFSGAQVNEYDGKQVVESNFHIYPEIGLVAATSGGNLADGDYQVKCIHSWIDASGQIHQSADSVAGTATVSGGGGSGKITCYIPTIFNTNKSNSIFSVFCTDTDGTVFYLDDSVENDKTAAEVNVAITTIDTAAAQPYTADGTIANYAPPHCTSIVRKKDRLFTISGDSVVSYTKPAIAREPALWTQETHEKRLSGDSGEFWRLAEVDGSVYAIGPYISQFFGDGLSALGAGDNLQGPVELATDSRLLPGTSVVRTDLGVFFQTERGLLLLDRSRQIQNVGTSIEGLGLTDLRASVIVPGKSQVRFAYEDSGIFSFGYDEGGQWADYCAPAKPAGAVNWAQGFAWVTAGGLVHAESSGFLDGAAPYSLLTDTGWLHVGGHVGTQRVSWAYILGTYKSPHTLRVEVFYDYATEASASFSRVISEELDPYLFRLELPRQECISLRFRVYDEAQSGSCESMSLNAIGLMAGPEPYMAKLGPDHILGAD